MNSTLGTVNYGESRGELVFEKPYSQATANLIDHEVRSLVNGAYSRTEKLLMEKREALEKVAQVLLTKEVLKREDMINLLGKRPFEEKLTYDELAHHK